MILCKTPTRTKHIPEISLLANLRFACLRAGSEVSQNQNVQRRSAELLKHLCTVLPSPEFQAAYIHQAGELGEGLSLRIDNSMSMVTIKRVTANNVVSLHKICISTTTGGVQ